MNIKIFTTSKLHYCFPIIAIALLVFVPQLSHADLQTSLIGIKSKLTGIILPTLSVIGLLFAAFSFFTGNPQAKQRAPQGV